MKLKYISYGNPQMPTYLVFPEMTQHSDVAKKIGIELVISAGFVRIDFKEKKAYPFGFSDSLNLYPNTNPISSCNPQTVDQYWLTYMFKEQLCA